MSAILKKLFGYKKNTNYINKPTKMKPKKEITNKKTTITKEITNKKVDRVLKRIKQMEKIPPIGTLSVVSRNHLKKVPESFYIKYPLAKKAEQWFSYYNDMVFYGKLKNKCYITWDGKLKTTGGHATYLPKTDRSCITLSVFVCQNEEQMKHVLMHEMCHSANYHIDNCIKAGHSQLFHKWGKRSKQIVGIKVTQFHQFKVDRNFEYKCNSCGHIHKVVRRNHWTDGSKCKKCNKGKYIEKK